MNTYFAMYGPFSNGNIKKSKYKAEDYQEARKKAVARWHVPVENRHLISVGKIG